MEEREKLYDRSRIVILSALGMQLTNTWLKLPSVWKISLVPSLKKFNSSNNLQRLIEEKMIR